VASAFQSTTDFRAFLRREIAREMPQDKSRRLSAAVHHMGLVDRKIDLVAAFEATLLQEAAAYYTSAEKKFFIVMVPDTDQELDAITSHELTHALQDQHFDFAAFTGPKALDDDALAARQFVSEGDATFSMVLYSNAESLGVQSVDSLVRLSSEQIDGMAAMTMDDFRKLTKEQSSSFREIDPDLKRQMESMGDLPETLLRPMFYSYMKGALLVRKAYEHGGWAAVNKLYKDPPTSTEQVLHPNKLFPTREPPVEVKLPAIEGEVLYSNVLGELQWAVYFSLWTDRSKLASEGWGGDRYTVVRRGDSLLAVHATIWDTTTDAKQFAEAYEASFAKRFPRKDRRYAVRVDGRKVFVLDGDDDGALMDRVASDTSFR
jgi:hypothetical protein